MSTEYLYGWRFEPKDSGTPYLTYNFENPSMFGVLTISPHGTLKLVDFLNKNIFLELEVDQNKSDLYGTCGPFGSYDN